LTGNYDGTSAVDYTVNCASGFPLITGDGTAPVNHVLPAWDIAAGLYLSTGLLAAERQRRKTGRGQELTIALSDVMLATLGNLGYLADFELNGTKREPLGNALYGAFGSDFPTSDGRRVMIVALTQRQWRNLMDATGLGATLDAIGSVAGLDLNDEGSRFRAHKAICETLAPWVAARSLSELRSTFDSHRVLWGPYQDVPQLMSDDSRCSSQNRMFQRVEQPGVGAYLTPGSPLSFLDVRQKPPRPAPRLGQHTDDLLRGIIGYSDNEIRRLRSAAVVA
jgi:2-methylfumaryl-CoA isomerase